MRAGLIFFLLLAGCSKRPSDNPEALYQISKSLLREGKLNDALSAAEQGLKLENSWRFRLRTVEILLAIDPKRAIESLDSSQVPPPGESRARFEMYRGWGRLLLADYRGAEASLKEARQMSRALNLAKLNAEIELDWGVLQAQRGDIAGADETFRNAVSQAFGQDDPYLQTTSMGRLGVLLLRTNHADQAIYWLEKQKAEAERIGWLRSAANAVGNIGWCYYKLGDYEVALRYLREAETAFRKIGDRREQQIWLGNIGSVFLDEDQSSEARGPYEKALAIARDIGEKSSTAIWLNNLAIVSINLGDFNAAERYNQEALALKKELKQSPTYPHLNEARIAAGRQDFEGAEKLFRSLLAEKSDDPSPILEGRSGLAELLIATKRYGRADAEFRSAIAAIDNQTASLTRDEYKLSYLSSLIKFYQYYVDFLVTQGETERALEVAESSRSRLLDERLRRGKKNEIPVNAAALKNVARSSGSTLLSYWLAPGRSFLFVITPARVELYKLPAEKQITTLLDVYRSQIDELRDPLESELSAGKKLSEMLLGRLRPLLGQNARFIVVPDRSLHSLNLETLPDPENASRYLIDRVTMSVAPSLALLGKARKAVNRQPSILLIGDPETAVEEYPRLLYAGKELSMIEQSFPPDRRVVAEGNGAYPAVYRESDPARFSWIHFAAHATTNRESPLDSALILSRHGSNYALTARDVMNVPLNADLVTLSACRSAGARTYSGEGLVGLSWAFLRAGAGSVVAGLWDVTDMSTATLMADFYGQLVKNIAPAEALRQAKLHLLHSNNAYRKPFYWGPFQLYTGVVNESLNKSGN